MEIQARLLDPLLMQMSTETPSVWLQNGAVGFTLSWLQTE